MQAARKVSFLPFPSTKVVSEECGNHQRHSLFPSPLLPAPEKTAAASPIRRLAANTHQNRQGSRAQSHPAPLTRPLELTNVGVLQQAADAGFTLQLLMI